MKKRPCIVLKSKGLSERQDGTFGDPDARVAVTIARDARGVPARVVEVELSNVDTYCYKWDANGGYAGRTLGPEVSASLAPLALQKRRAEYANGGYRNEFRFDPMAAVRTIGGLKNELGFLMDSTDRRLWIRGATADQHAGKCILDIDARLKQVRDRSAVARCKRMPTDTKKQRRKRAACLNYLRG